MGASALAGNLTGADNVALGKSALFTLDDDDNTAVGAFALSQLASGSDNIGVGKQAGSVLSAGSFNIYVGAQAGGATESSTIRIGRSAQQTRAFIAGIGHDDRQQQRPDGCHRRRRAAGVRSSSSRRTKFDIAGLDAAVTSALQALRPVQFRYRQAFADGSTPLQMVSSPKRCRTCCRNPGGHQITRGSRVGENATSCRRCCLPTSSVWSASVRRCKPRWPASAGPSARLIAELARMTARLDRLTSAVSGRR